MVRISNKIQVNSYFYRIKSVKDKVEIRDSIFSTLYKEKNIFNHNKCLKIAFYRHIQLA